MQDRVPLYPGRVKLMPVTGQPDTYDMIRADQPTQEGTPLDKATFLKDETAALYGLPETAVPDDVFKRLDDSIVEIGDIKVTARKDLDNSWLLCNGSSINASDYLQLSSLFNDRFWNVEQENIPIDNVLQVAFGNNTLVSIGWNTGKSKELLLCYKQSGSDEWIKSGTIFENASITMEADVKSFRFLNNNFVVLLGKSKKILYTSDVNTNWKTVSLTEDLIYNDIIYEPNNSKYVLFASWYENDKDSNQLYYLYSSNISSSWSSKKFIEEGNQYYWNPVTPLSAFQISGNHYVGFTYFDANSREVRIFSMNTKSNSKTISMIDDLPTECNTVLMTNIINFTDTDTIYTFSRVQISSSKNELHFYKIKGLFTEKKLIKLEDTGTPKILFKDINKGNIIGITVQSSINSNVFLYVFDKNMEIDTTEKFVIVTNFDSASNIKSLFYFLNNQINNVVTIYKTDKVSPKILSSSSVKGDNFVIPTISFDGAYAYIKAREETVV